MTADRAPKDFRLSRRVLFSETDVAGLVHFSNFFRYFEDAEHELWRQAGLSIHPENSPIGWHEFEISVHIVEMTKRTIRYEGTSTRGGQRVAAATWKIACVDRLPDGSLKSAEIPANVAERLKPFA